MFLTMFLSVYILIIYKLFKVRVQFAFWLNTKEIQSSKCINTMSLSRHEQGSLYWYIESLHILTNTYTTAVTTKQVARKVLFPPCLIEHIPLSQIKMTYTKKMLG